MNQNGKSKNEDTTPKPNRKLTRWTITVIAGLVLIFLLQVLFQSQNNNNLQPKKSNLSTQQWANPPEMVIDNTKQYTAVIETDIGNITVRLFAEESPITVNNFVFLAQQGYYDGVIFHRVIHNFMVQGGDPTGSGTGGPGYMFEDEVNNGLIFDKPGIVAMANSGPSTNGSQFFITHVPTPHLNSKHTIFGEIIDGMDIVFAIPEQNPKATDKAVVMRKVTIKNE
jgi:peptidyl-prolyl cis-trans isomerase B (cyclophilin B)